MKRINFSRFRNCDRCALVLAFFRCVMHAVSAILCFCFVLVSSIYKPAFDEDFEDLANLPKIKHEEFVDFLLQKEALKKEDLVLEEIKEELVEEILSPSGKDIKFIKEEIELENRLENELIDEINGPGKVSSAVEVEVEEERLRHLKVKEVQEVDSHSLYEIKNEM